jgi:hypothetical protein
LQATGVRRVIFLRLRGKGRLRVRPAFSSLREISRLDLALLDGFQAPR